MCACVCVGGGEGEVCCLGGWCKIFLKSPFDCFVQRGANSSSGNVGGCAVEESELAGIVGEDGSTGLSAAIRGGAGDDGGGITDDFLHSVADGPLVG